MLLGCDRQVIHALEHEDLAHLFGPSLDELREPVWKAIQFERREPSRSCGFFARQLMGPAGGSLRFERNASDAHGVELRSYVALGRWPRTGQGRLVRSPEFDERPSRFPRHIGTKDVCERTEAIDRITSTLRRCRVQQLIDVEEAAVDISRLQVWRRRS